MPAKNKNIFIAGITGTLGTAVKNLFEKNGYNCYGSSSKESGKNIFKIDFENIDVKEIGNMKIPELDALVITSGYEPQMNLTESTEEHFDKMINIHLKGPFLLIKYLRKKLKNNSCIILVSSIAAYKGSYDPSYATVKGGLISLTRSLARELAPDIRVNAIAPGLIDGSPVHKRMTDDFRKKHMDASLTKKLITPTECADAILFLVSEKNITGQILHINGGQFFGG
ncbi:MAG TPA: SDR family oxidoreductase [Ignavibacteria bacterium]|nr:SDR family oxidoreductase [Ignavibacteria bacterium]